MHAQKETPSRPAAGEGESETAMPSGSTPIVAATDAVVKREFVPLADLRRIMASEPPTAGLVPHVEITWRDTVVERRRLMQASCTCNLRAPCPVCCAWDSALRRIAITSAQIARPA